MDPALLSRFDASITFGLPSEACRRQILRQYARHLPESAIAQLAADAKQMSGRDLRDVAEQAERRWASKARSSFPAWARDSNELVWLMVSQLFHQARMSTAYPG